MSVFRSSRRPTPPATSVIFTDIAKTFLRAPPDPFEENYPELAELTRRVSRITGVPRMTPEEYAVVFECISSELKDAAYHLSSTSKSVRDLCIERGRSISRAFVTWVLRGIAYAEHPFNEPATNTPAALAESFLQNLLTPLQVVPNSTSPIAISSCCGAGSRESLRLSSDPIGDGHCPLKGFGSHHLPIHWCVLDLFACDGSLCHVLRSRM